MTTETPDQLIETTFVPDLRTPIRPLPPEATLADLIDRVNLLSLLLDQSIVDLIGDDGEPIETRER